MVRMPKIVLAESMSHPRGVCRSRGHSKTSDRQRLGSLKPIRLHKCKERYYSSAIYEDAPGA